MSNTYVVITGYYLLLVGCLCVFRLPVGRSLVSVHNGRLGLNLCSHAAPDLWWLFTGCYAGWGVEVYYTRKPYWPISTGFSRSIGVRTWRISWLFYLGRLGREVVIRKPPKTWYDLRF